MVISGYAETEWVSIHCSKLTFNTFHIKENSEVPPFSALPHCVGSVLSIIGELKLEELVTITDETEQKLILVFHLV